MRIGALSAVVLIYPNRVSNSLLYISNKRIIHLFKMGLRSGFPIISIMISLIVIPSFAIFSFSQSNNTLSSDLSSDSPLSNSTVSEEPDDDTQIENETSFASLSRSLAETNQSDDDQSPLPPSTESELESEDDQSPLPPSTESESEGETSEEDIQ